MIISGFLVVSAMHPHSRLAGISSRLEPLLVSSWGTLLGRKLINCSIMRLIKCLPLGMLSFMSKFFLSTPHLLLLKPLYFHLHSPLRYLVLKMLFPLPLKFSLLLFHQNKSQSQTTLFSQEDLPETTRLPPTYLNIFAAVFCHSIQVLSLLAVLIQSPLSAVMFL